VGNLDRGAVDVRMVSVDDRTSLVKLSCKVFHQVNLLLSRQFKLCLRQGFTLSKPLRYLLLKHQNDLERTFVVPIRAKHSEHELPVPRLSGIILEIVALALVDLQLEADKRQEEHRE